MFSIVLAFFLVQLTISIVLLYGSSKSKQYTPLTNYENTAVIIPFKNEARRILPLLSSINKAAITHKKTDLFSHLQFIFIDDHSTDNSTEFILNELDISFQIIRIRNTSGKKYAIKKGIELAQFDRILTLDADVNFDENFLDSIAKTPCDTLTILPVNMVQKNNLMSQINAVEFWFLQRLTFGLAGLKNYILCNGANLLFTKKAYNKSLSVRQDGDIASGDDIFFLKALKKLKLPILAIHSSNLTVNTLPPKNIGKLINQRKRWITKMTDLPSVLGGAFVLSSNVLLVYCIYQVSYLNMIFFIPIGVKIISELISVDELSKKLVTLVHQITYPFYLVLLLFSLMKKGNDWRG